LKDQQFRIAAAAAAAVAAAADETHPCPEAVCCVVWA
jgi:hypothetical protein